MKIVGIEGVQEFLDDGSLGSRSNMIVELKTGEQFRVPIGTGTHTMLTELGNMVALQTGGQDMSEYQPPTPVIPPATKLCKEQSLEDFHKSFVTGPNMGAPPIPPQMAETQQDLVGQLETLSSDEAMALAGEQANDPLSQLRKVGFLGEPADVVSAMSSKSEPQGADVIESFEDTSDEDDEDPGEEYGDDEIAEQY